MARQLKRKAGFFDHFNKNFFEFIAKPYREDAISTLLYSDYDKENWLVTDKTQFICRKVGPRIQDTLRWSCEESDEVKSIEVEIGVPDHESHYVVEHLLSYPANLNGVQELSKGVSLEKYREIDGLKINVIATYLQAKERYSAWYMVMPSRGFQITIIKPVGYEVDYDVFVTRKQLVDHENDTNYLRLIDKGWLLPENAIVWQLRRKKSALALPEKDTRVEQSLLLTHPSSAPQ